MLTGTAYTGGLPRLECGMGQWPAQTENQSTTESRDSGRLPGDHRADPSPPLDKRFRFTRCGFQKGSTISECVSRAVKFSELWRVSAGLGESAAWLQ